MVTLTEGDEGGDNVVARAVSVVKRLIAKPVGQAVDTECRLLDEEDPENPGVDEASQPVVPAKPTDHGRQNQSHREHAFLVQLA